MKATITAMLSIALAVLLGVPAQSFAQTQDTLLIYADPTSGPTLGQQIMGDTTATGQRKDPNRVYVLQQTGAIDTVYNFFNGLQTNYNVTIIGKRNPVTGMPPVIQPGVNLDGTAPSNFIDSRGTGDTITIKNIYYLGETFDSTHFTGNMIQPTGDSTTVILDHDLFDNFGGVLSYFKGNWNNFYMTNCEARNMSNQYWQAGNLMWANGGVPMDTVSIVNNTEFGLGRAAYGGPGYVGYLRYEHNTDYLGTGGLLLITHLTNALISNNIFYGVVAHGADSAYVNRGNANDADQPFGVVMVDSLSSVGATYNVTEAARHIVVENNAYYWPKQMYDYWNSVNKNAPNTVFPPTWMNEQTVQMFNNKTAWPYLVASKNDSVDPGFNASMDTTAVDSLMYFVSLIGYPPGNAGTFRWWYLPTNPYPGDNLSQVPSGWKGWQSGYPVPESMAYSNDSLQTAGTDGFALGDLNWYPAQLKLWEEGKVNAVKQTPHVPAKFSLSQNYPNPFNPSTEISVSLRQPGVMSLKIYNVLGQLVDVVSQGFRPAGNYVFNVNMNRFASGVYFYTLRQGPNAITRKMLLLK